MQDTRASLPDSFDTTMPERRVASFLSFRPFVVVVYRSFYLLSSRARRFNLLFAFYLRTGRLFFL